MTFKDKFKIAMDCTGYAIILFGIPALVAICIAHDLKLF